MVSLSDLGDPRNFGDGSDFSVSEDPAILERMREEYDRRYPGLFGLLGKVPDQDAVKPFELARHTGMLIRRKLGIPAFERKAKEKLPVPRPSVEQRYPGIVGKLGTCPDRRLGDEYGLTESGVCRLRQKLGISAFAKR